MASLPVVLAQSGARQSRFHQLYIAEKIRAHYGVRHYDDFETEGYEVVLERLSHPDEAKHLADTVAHQLDSLSKSEEMLDSAANLLAQSLVLTWSIFEILATDLFAAALNLRPGLIRLLLADERTKKWLQTKDLPALLERFSYDVSKNMGDILLASHRIDDLETIRQAFDVIVAGDTELRASLLQQPLWILNQRRNLILHRRGIVDEEYVKHTGEQILPGVLLRTTPVDLHQCLWAVRDAGIRMLLAMTPA